MNEFFSVMSQTEYTFWMIAIPSTIFFALQMIMTFMAGGLEADVDIDTDVDVDVDADGDSGGAPFQMFTFRNLIAFLTVFAWTGIICIDNNFTLTSTLVISSLTGLGMVIILTSLFFFTAKLAQNNSADVKHTVGRNATVYLKIPAMGKGKINVMYGGAKREEPATSKVEIPTGATVKVVGVEAGVLVVEPLTSEA
jgi:membrane protein implicated in regulation of membrane protease activity